MTIFIFDDMANEQQSRVIIVSGCIIITNKPFDSLNNVFYVIDILSEFFDSRHSLFEWMQFWFWFDLCRFFELWLSSSFILLIGLMITNIFLLISFCLYSWEGASNPCWKLKFLNLKSFFNHFTNYNVLTTVMQFWRLIPWPINHFGFVFFFCKTIFIVKMWRLFSSLVLKIHFRNFTGLFTYLANICSYSFSV